MTPSEFKAWFDGFTEAFGNKVPTKAQWERVKARVAEIDGMPVTERIYVDRYWPYYGTLGTASTSTPVRTWTTSGISLLAGSNNMVATPCSGTAFNSSQAMADLGRAEAASLAA